MFSKPVMLSMPPMPSLAVWVDRLTVTEAEEEL